MPTRWSGRSCGRRPPVPRLVRVCGRQTARAEITRARYGFEQAAERWQDLVERPRGPGPRQLRPQPPPSRALPGGDPGGQARLLREAPRSVGGGGPGAPRRGRSGGVVHMVGFNYRFLPAVALARRLVDEGRLGRIHHFRARFADASFLDPDAPFTWHQDAEAAGSNALLDLGSHLIDLARYLVGEPSAVGGAVATFTADRPDPDDGPAPPGRDGGRLRGDRRVRERRPREPFRHEHGGRPAGAHDLRAQRGGRHHRLRPRAAQQSVGRLPRGEPRRAEASARST